MNDKKPSVKRISEITGFSQATVSNALNNKRGVNRETADQIFKVADELGYSTFTKSVKSIKFVVIRRSGKILDESSFHPAVIEGVEQEARENNLETLFVTLDVSNADFEEQVRQLTQDINSAIILLGTEMKEDDYKLFKDCRCPLILLDGWNDECAFSSVLINNFNSSVRAVDYLIGKGHKKIGYIRGDFRIQAFSDRELGYMMALQTHNLKMESDYIVTVSTKTEAAYKDMCAYLENHKDIPTAFFADNDVMALGAIRALTQYGYNVPEDVSIIGFDDIVYASICNPPLTTIKVYKQEMGREAVRRLVSIINTGNMAKFKVESCTDLIERDSVKKIK